MAPWPRIVLRIRVKQIYGYTGMNLSLLDPFALAQEYPESLTHSIAWGHSSCVVFNKRGDYLASGLLDGTIVVFDFDTYGELVTLRGHTSPIQTLSWSKDSRYLLSASRDWKCILWDLASGKIVNQIKFPAPVWGAALHPNNHCIFVASLYEDQPRYVNWETNEVKILPSCKEEDSKQSTLVTIFDKSGNYVISGTSKGLLNIIDYEDLKILNSTKLTSSNIKGIKMSSSGRSLVINSSDRVIRLVRVPDLNQASNTESWEFEVEHKFQDVVNRLQWNSVAISATGEYVVASTYESAHDIYMWETSMGSLVKIYEGPKEELVELAFHPHKPLLAATGLDSGTIYIWSSVMPQKWSALAPDFVELEENIYYEEKEDEFDLVDDEEQDRRQQDDEEGEVDILTIDTYRGGELSNDSFLIPVRLDVINEQPPVIDNDD